jgi:serine/threonine protein phosphatase PrpC
VSDSKLVEGWGAHGGVGSTAFSGQCCGAVTSYAGVTKKGFSAFHPKKQNQDALLLEEHEATGSVICGVFDGHGEAGDLCSVYFTDRLPRALAGNPRFAAEPLSAMVEELARAEAALLKERTIDSDFSGTTGVLCVVRGRRAYVCNVGDSRVIGVLRGGEGAAVEVMIAAVPVGDGCGGGGGGGGGGAAAGAARPTATPPPVGPRALFSAQAISEDHKPDLPGERARIEATGGRVFATTFDDGDVGPARVYLADADIPGLAMSRSLGDALVHGAGVTSTPQTHVVELGSAHAALVVASDGLWEFCSSAEVAQWTGEALAGAGGRGGGGGGGAGAAAPAELLARVAATRWMEREQVIDDITVVVVALHVECGAGELPAPAAPAPAPAPAPALVAAPAQAPGQKSITRRGSFLQRLMEKRVDGGRK